VSKLESKVKIEHELLSMKDLELVKERKLTSVIVEKILSFKESLELEKTAYTNIDKNLLEQAIELFNNKQYNLALQNFMKILVMDEKNELVNQYIALCYCYLGDYHKAEKYALKVLEINPENEKIKSWLKEIKK
jgi:tetratricopeptide (TPR) repeat protein